MDIDYFILLIQVVFVFITAVNVYLVYINISSNRKTNEKKLFDSIINQEMSLRFKLGEYRNVIHNSSNDIERKNAQGDYDTLVFNFFEYLGLCVFRNFIDEGDAKIFFKKSLISVRELFDKSFLFDENYADKSDYVGLQWLIKRWNI